MFGPVWLVELRIAMAAIMLAFVAWITARPLRLQCQWRQIAILGALNTALPFLLLTYAAQSLNASVLSVLNATAPVFGAIVGAIWLKQALSLRASIGLSLGIAGGAALVWSDLVDSGIPSAIPVVAVLCTALCYGFSSNDARRHAGTLDHFNSAHGSLWVAVVLILPATPFFPAPGPVSPGSIVAATTLGIVCTGIAYLLYFKLIRDVGPMSALTVAYLIPVFGVLWGVAFLGEPVTPALLIGGALVMLGTALATGVGAGKQRLDKQRLALDRRS